MQLREWLVAKGRGAVGWLARAVNAHAPDLSRWASGTRPIPIERCPAIERATDGAVSRLRQLGDAQGDLKKKTEDATDSLLKQASALESLGDGVERVGEGFRNKDGLTSDEKGNAQTMFKWTRASIIDYLKQAGLDDLLAEDLSKQFVQPDGSVPYFASQAQKQWGGKYSTLAGALGKMVDYYKYGAGQQEAANRLAFLQGNASGGSSTTNTSATATTASTASAAGGGARNTGSTRTGNSGAVNLTINLQGAGSLSNREEMERLARQLMPAITNLTRKGFRSS